MQNRTPLLTCLIWIGMILYTVAFSEAFVRVFDPQPLMPRNITGTAWGVRGNIPNAQYWIHTPEVDVPYKINALGMRADREYAFDKPPGVCRVALFGDSFFFGVEVDLADSLAGQLERTLNERGTRAEVLNFAVGGFGTAEMLQTYEAFGRKFDPDVVLFSWDLSDPTDNVRADLYRLHDGRLERANAEYLPGVRVQDFLMRFGLYRLLSDHSQLYTFLRDKIYSLIKKRLVTNRGAKAGEESADRGGGAEEGGEEGDEDGEKARRRRYAIDLSSALLLRARDEVVANGSDFYLVEIPVHVTRMRILPSIGELPVEVTSGIKIVSTTPALSRAARPDLKLFFEKGQEHLTPVGTGILVRQIADALAKSPRLASCTARTNAPGHSTP